MRAQIPFLGSILTAALVAGCPSPDSTPDAATSDARTLDASGTDAMGSDAGGADVGATCPIGQTVCDDACVTLETDRQNCGACGRRCAMGEVCSASTCRIDCSAPAVPCTDSGGDMYCADLSDDEDDCGVCGRACDLGWSCLGGACQLVCPTGQDACDATCANLATDPHHCGACGISCDRDHAVGVCRDRVCAIACEIGFGDCDHLVDTGCEENIATSLMHCGTCGRSCLGPHVAMPTCEGGVCGIEACEDGYEDCNSLATDGCEASLSSPSSCGACGRTCRTGHSCVDGACLAVPVPGTWGVPPCGTTGATATVGVDAVTQDIYTLIQNTASGTGFRGCAAVSYDGGMNFVSRSATLTAGWGGTWNTGGTLTAHDGVVVYSDGGYAMFSFNGGAAWDWRNSSRIAAAVPDAVLWIENSSSNRIVRSTAGAPDLVVTLSPAPTSQPLGIWWDPEGNRAWTAASRTGGQDLYYTSDEGRTWNFLPMPTNWLAIGVSGSRIAGTGAGSVLQTATLSMLTPVAATCTGCAFSPVVNVPIRPALGEVLVMTANVTGMGLGFARAEPGMPFVPRSAPGFVSSPRSFGVFSRTPAVAYLSGSSVGIVSWE